MFILVNIWTFYPIFRFKHEPQNISMQILSISTHRLSGHPVIILDSVTCLSNDKLSHKISRKNFRTAPYINYACILLSSKTMTYSQVYWIYTFLIATYFINKNGFRCVRLFSLSALRFPSFFSVSFHSLSPFFLPRSFSPFFLYLSLSKPRTPSLHLTFGLPVHLLYHYTTVISWSLLGDKLLLSLPSNEHD